MKGCPICSKKLLDFRLMENIDGMYYNCRVCGKYGITGPAENLDLKSSDYINKKYIISARSREGGKMRLSLSFS